MVFDFVNLLPILGLFIFIIFISYPFIILLGFGEFYVRKIKKLCPNIKGRYINVLKYSIKSTDKEIRRLSRRAIFLIMAYGIAWFLLLLVVLVFANAEDVYAYIAVIIGLIVISVHLIKLRSILLSAKEITNLDTKN